MSIQHQNAMRVARRRPIRASRQADSRAVVFLLVVGMMLTCGCQTIQDWLPFGDRMNEIPDLPPPNRVGVREFLSAGREIQFVGPTTTLAHAFSSPQESPEQRLARKRLIKEAIAARNKIAPGPSVPDKHLDLEILVIQRAGEVWCIPRFFAGLPAVSALRVRGSDQLRTIPFELFSHLPRAESAAAPKGDQAYAVRSVAARFNSDDQTITETVNSQRGVGQVWLDLAKRIKDEKDDRTTEALNCMVLHRRQGGRVFHWVAPMPAIWGGFVANTMSRRTIPLVARLAVKEGDVFELTNFALILR